MHPVQVVGLQGSNIKLGLLDMGNKILTDFIGHLLVLVYQSRGRLGKHAAPEAGRTVTQLQELRDSPR